MAIPVGVNCGTGFTSQKEAQEIMQKLLEEADDRVKAEFREEDELFAVVTVPAAFRDQEKKLVRDAAARVKLKSGRKITGVGVIAKPAAAALGYFGIQEKKNDSIFVYDLGGESFDAAVVRPTGDPEIPYEVLWQDGRGIGGNDWDKKAYGLMQEKLCAILQEEGAQEEEIKDFLRVNKEAHLVKAREIKERLSEQEQVYADGISYQGKNCGFIVTREEFEKSAKRLSDTTIRIASGLKEIVKQMYPEINLCQVIMTGGGCRMPHIQKAVREAFADCEVKMRRPETAAAYGAGRYAETFIWNAGEAKAPRKEAPKPQKKPITLRASHSYGIIYNCREQKSKRMTSVIRVFIRRGDILPASMTVESQTGMKEGGKTAFQIVEINDDKYMGTDLADISLGNKIMEVIFSRGDGCVEKGRSSRETLTLAEDGILTTKSTDLADGRTVEKSVETRRG